LQWISASLLSAFLVVVNFASSEIFGQEAGRWASGAPLPSARSEIAAARAGGRIYVIGDYGGQRATEIYDPVTNTWRRGADFPLAIHHTAAVGWKDKVYVLGGYVDDWRPTDGVYEYDIG
jgi:N-acetylneuraminic acid mutarotase